jgi:hypothetical protein
MSKKDSIKGSIAGNLLKVIVPMKTNGSGIRTIKRVLSPFLTEATLPAIHLVIGHERVIDQDERGYNCEFPASFKIILEEKGDDRYWQADELVAWIQEAVEADEQLGGLCSKITYAGDQPYIDELIPGGFILVSYRVEYRRMKSQPNVGY